MNKEGITVAGNLIADVVYTIYVYPQKGNLTWMRNPVAHTGGINNLIIDLARLDSKIPIKVSGVVGDDENGQFIVDSLREYPNINIEGIVKKGRTAVTFAMTEKESKQRTFFFDPGTSLEFNEKQIDFKKIKADIFHLEYLLLLGTLDQPDEDYGTKAAKVLATAQKYEMETSVDMVSEEGNRYQKVVWPALKYTDYCVVNEVEGTGVTGIQLYDKDGIKEENMRKGLEKLKELGVKKWAIIHSPACGYGLNCQTGEFVKVPSFKLPKGFIKGTTGAGDAFCSGVLYAAYQRESIEKALYYGAITAACSLSKEDSTSGVMDLKEMKLFMKTNV